jgi:lipopolysaccharide export system permease protein
VLSLSGFFRRNFRFGILQRYVLGEILRAFGLALLTITCVFVLLTVMTKAASIGLGPYEILKFIPYMIPGSLPYTVPVSLLFSATVVYGRLASDNEVIAVKTAGLSAMTLIWPSILLSLILSVSLNHLSASFIPNTNAAVKKIIYHNLEDFFYKTLKMERIVDFPTWPFLIKVNDVDDRLLIKPIFKKRAPKPDRPLLMSRPAEAEEPAAFEMIVEAKTATIDFKFEQEEVAVYFEKANIMQRGSGSQMNVNHTTVIMPIPGKGQFNVAKMVEEMTVNEMLATQKDYQEKIALERKQQAVAAAWYIGAGQLDKVGWDKMQSAFKDYDYWQSECKKYEIEIQMRQAMAWGSFFFVILGAPVGIIFARRDFLSAFISCFMPIILLYYPLMLFGVNLGKEGLMPPILVWSGNIALGLAAWFWARPPVMKH